eukprot:3936990-Rhodomonas_salina.4
MCLLYARSVLVVGGVVQGTRFQAPVPHPVVKDQIAANGEHAQGHDRVRQDTHGRMRAVDVDQIVASLLCHECRKHKVRVALALFNRSLHRQLRSVDVVVEPPLQIREQRLVQWCQVFLAALPRVHTGDALRCEVLAKPYGRHSLPGPYLEN